MNWDWISSSTARYSVLPGSDMPEIMNRTIFNTQVQFNLIDVGPPLTNIIATVFNPLQLNGTRMTCGGQSLTILIPKHISKFTGWLLLRLTYYEHLPKIHSSPLHSNYLNTRYCKITYTDSITNKYLMCYSNVNVTTITSYCKIDHNSCAIFHRYLAFNVNSEIGRNRRGC